MRIARCIAFILLLCVSGAVAAQSVEKQEDTIPYIISYYIVKRPDIVTNVAYKLKVDPVTIVKLNRLRNVNQLLVEGQRIKIPEYYKGYTYQPPVKAPTAASKEEEMPAARAVAVEQTTTGRYVIANNQKDDERELDSFRYEQTSLLYQEIKYKQLEAQAKIDALHKTDIPDNDQSTQATLKRMEQAKKIAQLEQPLIQERDSLAQIVAPLETQLKGLSEKLEKPIPVVQAPVIEPDPIIVAANTKPAKDDKKRDERENKRAEKPNNIPSDTVLVAAVPEPATDKNNKENVKQDSKVVVSDATTEAKGKRNKDNKNADKDVTTKDTNAPIAMLVDTAKPAVVTVGKVEEPKPVEAKTTPEPKKAEPVAIPATDLTAKADTASKPVAANKKTLNEDNGTLKRPGKAPKDTVATVVIMPKPSAPDTAVVAKKDKPAKRVPRDASITEQNVKLSTVDTFSTAVKPAKKDTVAAKPVEASKPVVTPAKDTLSTAEVKNKKEDKRSNKQTATDTVVKIMPVVTANDTAATAEVKPNKKEKKANKEAVKDTVVNPSTVIITATKDTVTTAQLKGSKKDKRSEANNVNAKDTITKQPEPVKPVAATSTNKDTVSTAQLKGNKTDKKPAAETMAVKDTVSKATVTTKPATTTTVAKDTVTTAQVKNNKTEKKPAASNTIGKDTVITAKPAVITPTPAKDTIATAQVKSNKNDKKTTAAKDTVVNNTAAVKPVAVTKDTVTTAQVKNNKTDKKPVATVAKDTVAKVAPVVVIPAKDTVSTAQAKPVKTEKKPAAAKDTVVVIRPLPAKDTTVVVQQTPRPPKPAIAIRDTSGQIKVVAPVSITAKADTAKAYNKEVTVTIPPKLTVDSVQFIKAAFSLERAKRAIESRDFKEAETHIKKSLSLYPQYNDAFILSGDVFSAQGKLDKAIDAYTNSTKLDSNNAKVFYNLAQLYVNSSKPNDALKAYNKAIRLDNKYVMAYIGRAALYNDMQDYKASVADYDKVIELNRFYTYAYKARGNTKFLKEDYQGSIEDFNRYLDMEDQDAQVFYQRGLAKLKLNQLLQGCMDFDSAFRLGYKEAEKAIKKYCE